LAVLTPIDEADLPGMALGSPPLLVAERATLLFATWLAGMVVVLQAWQGHLPVEVSGRGIWYAGQEFADTVRAAAERHERDIEAIRLEIDDLRSLSGAARMDYPVPGGIDD
jgi:hypothetical protein